MPRNITADATARKIVAGVIDTAGAIASGSIRRMAGHDLIAAGFVVPNPSAAVARRTALRWCLKHLHQGQGMASTVGDLSKTPTAERAKSRTDGWGNCWEYFLNMRIAGRSDG